MSSEETRQVVEGFLSSLAGHWLAEDVDLYDSARSRHHRGRAEVVARLAEYWWAPVPHLLIIDQGYAAIEVVGKPPACPFVAMAAILEIRTGEIVAARLYFSGAVVSAIPGMEN